MSNKKNSNPNKPSMTFRILTGIFVIVAIFFGYVQYDSSDSDTASDTTAIEAEAEYSDSTDTDAVEDEDIDDAESESGDSVDSADASEDAQTVTYVFRSSSLREEHYEKHGIEMGFASAEEYEAAASAVVNNPDALHKTEAEDGDDVYYVEDTNEFVIVSTDGYLRTYFYPSDGIAYYNRQ